MSKFRIIVVLLLCEALQSFGQTTVTFDFTGKEFVESTLKASTSIFGNTDVPGMFTYDNIKFANAVIKHYNGKDQYWLSIQKGVETAISSLTDKNIISIKFYISGSSASYFAQLRINGNSIPYNNTGVAEWSGKTNSITATSVQIPIPIDKIEVTYESTVSLPTISIDGNNENTSNSPIIETNRGKTVDVVLNRSFEGNNGWYTLCLPFDLTMDQMNTAFGNGVDVETMSDVVKGNDGVLSVNFTKSTDGISGGNPYLIKPSVSVDNPKFTDVTINAKTPTKQTIEGCEFIGIYDPTTISADSKNHFLNSEGSYLVSSTGIGKLKATRAYFVLPTSNPAKVMTGQEETTGIGSIKTSTNKDVIYNMNGQRVNSNLISGIYIINGKKVAIRK